MTKPNIQTNLKFRHPEELVALQAMAALRGRSVSDHIRRTAQGPDTAPVGTWAGELRTWAADLRAMADELERWADQLVPLPREEGEDPEASQAQSEDGEDPFPDVPAHTPGPARRYF